MKLSRHSVSPDPYRIFVLVTVVKHLEVSRRAQKVFDPMAGHLELPAFDDRPSSLYVETVLTETFGRGYPVLLRVFHIVSINPGVTDFAHRHPPSLSGALRD